MGKSVPQEFNLLVAATVPFLPKTAPHVLPEDRRALHQAVRACWKQRRASGMEWPPLAGLLLDAAGDVVLGKADHIPVGAIGEATNAKWGVTPAWQQRADIGG